MTRRGAARRAGFSLIELLVSMAIGLILTLAVTSVLIRSESSKRSTTAVNDINQTGAYAAYALDRVIRSAGSGFSQRWSDVYGCLLDVSKGSTHVLPLPAAIPASSAFAGLTMPIRLAPVIIGKGLADTTGAGAQVRGDVLLVMGGTAGIGESPQPVNPGSVTTSPGPQLLLPNTLGYRTGDLVLLADGTVTSGCMMQQVGTHLISNYGQTLPLAGTYYATNGTNVNLTDFGASTVALQLGNATSNPPQFLAYGVGGNQTLVSYDLLQSLPAGGAVPDVPIADGVVEMRALYGLDTTNPPDGVLDSWIDPVAGSGYEASVLTDGSTASRAKLRQIVAIRLGFILRTALAERSTTSASGVLSAEVYGQPALTTLTLFGDLSPSTLHQTRTLGATELNYRFRTVEVTVPLRNVQLAPNS